MLNSASLHCSGICNCLDCSTPPQPDLAGKITGMLLEMDNSGERCVVAVAVSRPSQLPACLVQPHYAPAAELLLLLEDSTALDAKVEEAVSVSGMCGLLQCLHCGLLRLTACQPQTQPGVPRSPLQVLKQHQAIPDGAVVREKGQ